MPTPWRPPAAPDWWAAVAAETESSLAAADPADRVYWTATLAAEAETRAAQALLAARKAGISWTDLSHVLGVSVGSVRSRVAAAERELGQPTPTPPPPETGRQPRQGVSVSEAARRLGVSRSRAQQLAWAGRLVRHPDGSVREESLAALIEERARA